MKYIRSKVPPPTTIWNNCDYLMNTNVYLKMGSVLSFFFLRFVYGKLKTFTTTIVFVI